MKRLIAFVSSLLVTCTACATTFNLFSPATGVLKGNSSTYVTTAATSTDIISMFAGCSGTQYLGADGSCHTISSIPGGSNTQVQFNNSGAFGGSSGLTWTSGTSTLAATNITGNNISQNGNQVLDTGQSAQTIFFTSNSNGQGLAIVNGSTGVSATNEVAVSNSSHTIRSALTSTGYTGASLLTGGPTGEAGYVYQTGSVPISFGTNGVERARIYAVGGMTVGAPTGGNQGAGTLNATGLYVNGVAVGSGSGTVTSVALTVPSGLSVTGSPVTTSGTLAITTALNGPVRGNGSGLTTGNLNVSTETTGTLPVNHGGTGVATITGIVKGSGTSNFAAAVSSDVYGLWSGSCSSSTFLRGDGACAAAGVSFPLSAPNGSSGAPSYSFSSDTTSGIYYDIGSGGPFFKGSSVSVQAGSSNLNLGSTSGSVQISSNTGTFVTGNAGLVVGSPTGGNQGIGTVNATGVYINGVAVASGTTTTGTFTCTWTGFTTTITSTCGWTKTGNTVTVFNTTNTTIVGTSNSTSMSITGLPAAIQPTHLVGNMVGGICNSGVCFNIAYATIASPFNTIELGLCSSISNCTGGNYAASGTKGDDGFFTMTYAIN